MNLQAIITTNCIGFALLIILLISSHLVRQRQQLSDNMFTAMIILTASACITEMLTFIFDGNTSYAWIRTLNMAGTSWLYLVNVLDSYLWCIYVELRLYHDVQRTRRRGPFIGIPMLMAVIAVILNCSYQFLFSINEQNVYQREIGGYIYYTLTTGYLFYSLVIRWQYNRKFGKDRFFPIYMFIAPIILGATAQFFIYGISIGWCCTAIGLVSIYMSLQNELSYIDPLTKLYNRNYLDHMLNHISRKEITAGGIMIDLDYFKSINDQYGHTVGDEALVEAARIIRLSIPEKALPVRFAGDEFIILIRNGEEETLLQIEETLREGVKNFNQTSQKPYQLSFSLGHSVHHPETLTDAFLNEMDHHMYEEKNKKHCRSSRNTANMPA